MRRSPPSRFTMGCSLLAFLGVLLVITEGDLHVLSSASGDVIPALLMFMGVSLGDLHGGRQPVQPVAAALYDVKLHRWHRRGAPHRRPRHDRRVPDDSPGDDTCDDPLGDGPYDWDF